MSSLEYILLRCILFSFWNRYSPSLSRFEGHSLMQQYSHIALQVRDHYTRGHAQVGTFGAASRATKSVPRCCASPFLVEEARNYRAGTKIVLILVTENFVFY